MNDFFIKLRFGIMRMLGLNLVINNQQQLLSTQQEIKKALIFNSTVCESEWLRHKSFSPGGWAVDFGFLYTLYRVLNDMHPQSILEFGLGQSSKMVHQYAHFVENVKAVTGEHDKEWIGFFEKGKSGEYPVNIVKLDLEEVVYKGEKTRSFRNVSEIFKGQTFDLILVDAPFGSPRYSRSQILELVPQNLAKRFCIIIDDYDREGEKETVRELLSRFKELDIAVCANVYSGSKSHCLICSEDLKFLTSL